MSLSIYLSIILGDLIISIGLNILKGNDFANDRIRFIGMKHSKQIRLEMMARN